MACNDAGCNGVGSGSGGPPSKRRRLGSADPSHCHDVEGGDPVATLQPITPRLLETWHQVLNTNEAEAWRDPHWLPLMAEHTATSTAARLLMSTVYHLKKSLQGVGRWSSDIAGVEFWTQRRAQSASLHLHWDIDEEHGRWEKKMRCPVLSVIVYTGNVGGPTLVLDRRSAEADDLDGLCRTWLSWPVAGGVTVIEGDLLHGVLGDDRAGQSLDQRVNDGIKGRRGWNSEPGCATAAGSGTNKIPPELLLQEQRITLIFNFWTERPEDLPPLPKVAPPSHLAASARVQSAVTTAPVARGASDGGARSCNLGAGHPPEADGDGAQKLPKTVLRALQATASSLAKFGSKLASRRLLLGMCDRQQRLELVLPPMEYRGVQLEALGQTKLSIIK
jgi:hypothetical protein